MLRLLFLLFLLLAVGCQPPKKQGDSGIISGYSGGTTTGGTTSGGGGAGNGGTTGGGGGNGPVLSVDPGSAIFNFVYQDISLRLGISTVSPAMPANGNPAIDASSPVTNLVAPALPSAVMYNVQQVPAVSGTGGGRLVNATAVMRAHDVTINTSATSCSSSMSLNCAVDGSNDRVLNLTQIDTSTFTPQTSTFALTVNSTALSVPFTQHRITASQANFPAADGHQMPFPDLVDATFLGDYFYYIGLANYNGSQFNALFRIHRSTYDTEPVYNPTQSTTTGGRLKSIVAFNGRIYFGSRPSGFSDYRLLVYNPANGSLSQISSATQLLNPEKFLVHNNHLYFAANAAGSGKRLYKMSTSGAIKQLTSLCGTQDDVGHKMISTPAGIYLALSDPAGCAQDRIIVRLNNNDTVQGLAFYRPGFIDTQNDGLGMVVRFDNRYYFSAGDNYFLYQDHLNGTLTALVTETTSGVRPLPVKKFVVDERGVYWIASSNASTFYPLHYNFNNARIEQIYYSAGQEFTEDEIHQLGSDVVVLGRTGTNPMRYQRITDDLNLVPYFTLNTAAGDLIKPIGTYQGEPYFFARTSQGQKLWKMSSDGVFTQVSNVNPGESDFDLAGADLRLTTGGILFPWYGFMLVFQ
jgi:hypothetical protein